MSSGGRALNTIPAVGGVREEKLRAAGLESISDVADAETKTLTGLGATGKAQAKCIRHGAKEIRGDQDSVIARIAEDCGATRDDVADMFSSIAHRSTSFRTTQAALREYFGDTPGNSILGVEEISFLNRYQLYQDGFQTVEEVAAASTSSLSDVSYINGNKAKEIQQTVQKTTSVSVEIESQEQGESSELEGSGDDGPILCDSCGKRFKFESVYRKHTYDCDGEAEVGSNQRSAGEFTQDEAVELLQSAVGEDAAFRPGQWEAIDRLVNNNDRVLLVQRTGWGKSTVYFIATRALRDQGAGPTLVISPLLSLMRNQIDDAGEELGLDAVTINSNNRDDWAEIRESIVEGTCDLVLISPERLGNNEFREKVLGEMEQGFGMLVVDEAHCISDWGHDFRPDYRRIKQILKRLPENLPVVAATATANDRVVDDITTQLPDVTTLRGNLLRESLRIQTVNIGSRERRLAWLAENVTAAPSAGIVYCLTKDDVDKVASWLSSQGLDVRPYYGSLDGDERRERERLLMKNEVDALVATNALGMGYNKPDLAFVIHFQRPPNLIRYYQEIGRAGRKLDEAYAILLSGEEDDDIAEHFIEQSFPEPSTYETVLSIISDSEEPVNQWEVKRKAGVQFGQTETCLKVLQVEGAIAREKEGFVRTPNPWEYDYERVRRVTQQRWDELDRMQEFVKTDDCLALFIDEELDGNLGEPCGQCANCVGEFLPNQVQDESMIDEAIEHYQNEGGGIIYPRTQIPRREQPDQKIDREKRLNQGRALSTWNEPGWGQQVRIGKYEEGLFPDELVAGASDFVTDQWEPDPAPEWVTAVPSTSTDGVVTDFAERLADRLEIPFEAAITKTRETKQQKQMEDNYGRCHNVRGAFSASTDVREAPVLLVDDVVASGWTLTEAGRVLRGAGSGPVYPLALAERRGD